jgi:glycosyltransferase involved in cell wall biosynthesis
MGPLAAAYAGADVFVFPSLTDTFGLVMIEALASGVPVAAFPVRGPIDIITSGGCGPDNRAGGRIGALAQSLEVAIAGALTANRTACGRLHRPILRRPRQTDRASPAPPDFCKRRFFAPPSPKAVRAEPVEAPSFSIPLGRRAGPSFDTLRTSGRK